MDNRIVIDWMIYARLMKSGYIQNGCSVLDIAADSKCSYSNSIVRAFVEESGTK